MASPPDDDVPLDEALAAARPTEAPGLLLAKSSVAAQLFGAAAPGFGRFRVLERLGGGGMGVVYSAYDPQLDRGVALKTVHVPRQSQELALREAKALAKLSHPNVVSVFDVGIEQGHVYIVMELVRGKTLRAWVSDQPALAVVDAYRQAALALAAAHDGGLVHRDFKPDNAIVGVDGRVRVVDFGLAIESEVAGGVAGTPMYMAPEQAAGAPATPAADQYSFGVSLAEALPEPRPAWIEAILARARAEEPAKRFPSMHEVVRALGRDPARRRRLVAAGVAVALVGATVVSFAIGRSASSPVEPCGGGAEEIASAWAPEAQHAQLARIAALSSYGRDLAAQLEGRLATHREQWIANLRGACLAHRRGEQSDALLDRRIACLDRGRAALAAVGELTRTATVDTLPELAQAASELPVPDACADVAALVDDVEPPMPAIAPQVAGLRRELARARIQIAAGHFAEARAIGDGAAAAARILRYEPVVAEAQLVSGHALVQLGDQTGAITTLGDATTRGLANGLDAIGIEAWARRAYIEGTSDAGTSALAGVELIDALASRSRSAFAHALLANNIGTVQLARSDPSAARKAFEEALRYARTVQGPGAVELVNVRTNMALVVDDPAERDRLFADARAELARLLGPDHPETLLAEWNRAMKTMTSVHEARAYLTSVCTRDLLHPSLGPRTAVCWVELAELGQAEGDLGAARTAIERAIVLGAATNDETPETSGYALLWRGDAAGAIRVFERGLVAMPEERGELWFRTYTRAKLQLGLARALITVPDPVEARSVITAALDAFTRIAREQHAAAIDRKLAAAQQLNDSLTSRARATSTGTTTP